MLSIKDPLLSRVVDDFDMMLNATIERMKEHHEEKGEITLKLNIELTKDRLDDPENPERKIPVDVPHIGHKVKSKWSGGRDFEGAVTESMCLVGKEKEDYRLIRRKDAQISMFEGD